MKGCIKVLKDQPPNSVEGLLNALRSVLVPIIKKNKNPCCPAWNVIAAREQAFKLNRSRLLTLWVGWVGSCSQAADRPHPLQRSDSSSTPSSGGFGQLWAWSGLGVKASPQRPITCDTRSPRALTNFTHLTSLSQLLTALSRPYICVFVCVGSPRRAGSTGPHEVIFMRKLTDFLSVIATLMWRRMIVYVRHMQCWTVMKSKFKLTLLHYLSDIYWKIF